MNLKRLIENVTLDWPAKVICLCLAVFIYTFHQISTISSKTFTVPLDVVSDGALMSTDVCPSFIKVTSRTNPEKLLSVTSKDFTACLNLTGYTEPGVYDVPITFQLSEALLSVEPMEISISPETVKLNLEKKVLRYVPVTVSTSGEPDSGYYVSNMEISPSSIKVIGPESVVNVTKEIYTKKVMVKGAKKTFSTATQIDNINTLLQVVPESEYKVTVEISQQQDSRSFEKIPVTAKGLRDGFILTSTLPVCSFELSGSVNNFSKINQKNLVTVDLGSIHHPGTFELPLKVNVWDFSVSKLNPEKIKVTVVREVQPVPESEAILPSGAGSISSESQENSSALQQSLENSDGTISNGVKTDAAENSSGKAEKAEENQPEKTE